MEIEEKSNTEGQENEKTSFLKLLNFDLMAKYTKYIVSASIPILYVQGLAYQQGKLDGFRVPSTFYPINLEDALLDAFSFYVGIIKYIFYIAIVWFAFVCLIIVLNDMKQKYYIKKEIKIFFYIKCFIKYITSNANKFVCKLTYFIIDNKSNFIPPGLLIFSVYVLLALSVVVAVPYLFGSVKSSEKLNVLLKSNKFERAVISFKAGVHKNEGVYIIHSSEKFVSVYDGHSVTTYPIGQISSIAYSPHRKDSLPKKTSSLVDKSSSRPFNNLRDAQHPR